MSFDEEHSKALHQHQRIGERVEKLINTKSKDTPVATKHDVEVLIAFIDELRAYTDLQDAVTKDLLSRIVSLEEKIGILEFEREISVSETEDA